MPTTLLTTAANEPEESPLSAAVRRFNEESALHQIGKHQIPLTEEEVIAAIHCWESPHSHGDEAWTKYTELARTRSFPSGARIYARDSYGCRSYQITVWWIYLDLIVGEGRYAFRIRDQKIDSRKCTDDELARMRGGPSFKDS